MVGVLGGCRDKRGHIDRAGAFPEKEKAALNLPTIFFCSFEQLRNFYFELDETVYGENENIEGDN